MSDINNRLSGAGGPHRKKRRRRRNLSLYYLLLLILVIIVGCVLSTTVFFKIQTISISGDVRYDEAEILAACPIKVGDNLVLAGTSKAEELLYGKMGYVDSVKVKKVFPDKIEIIFVPSVPYAYIEGEECCYLISSGGRILEITDERNGSEPLIKGYDPQPLKLGDILISLDEKKEKVFENIKGVLDDYSDMKIDSVDISDRYNLVVRCENRVNIELGSQVDLEYKMSFAKELMESRIPKNKEGTIFIRNNKEASFVEKKDLEQYEKSYQDNLDHTETQQEETSGTETED